MWKDEIREEIHALREKHAESFNYDLQAICEDLRRKQAKNGKRMISQPLKRPGSQNNESLHSVEHR